MQPSYPFALECEAGLPPRLPRAVVSAPPALSARAAMAEPALAVEERGLLLGDDAQTSSSAAPRRRRRHLALAGLVVA